MNDYALDKWARELICMYSTTMFSSEIVKISPVNWYGLYKEYIPYKKFIRKFLYQAVNGKEIIMYRWHGRIHNFCKGCL